jgi:L-amino acid N-acyltransferase YncA
MEKVVKLKDDSEVTVRPMVKEDLEKSFSFFQSLPPEDRTYLRSDVTKFEVVKRRVRAMEFLKIKRLVALSKDEIVAEGALEMEGHEWKEHIAELRLIVAKPFQRKGLGMLMARELYLLAVKEKVEEVVVRMMKPQMDAVGIWRRLGFTEDVTLHDYVKDLEGIKHDLVIMRCDLKSLWREMEEYFADTDWQRYR